MIAVLVEGDDDDDDGKEDEDDEDGVSKVEYADEIGKVELNNLEVENVLFEELLKGLVDIKDE